MIRAKRSRGVIHYVFLLGRNKRAYTRREKNASLAIMVMLVFTVIFASMLLGLLVLYIIKSALGIDLFSDTSLGIWDQFKQWLG